MLRNAHMIIVAAIAYFAGATAFAVGTSEDVRIVEMATSRTYGNYVFIRLSAIPQTPASCSVNGYWHFTLSLDDTIGKNLYAQLLTAYATNSLINITGSGVCGDFGAVESMVGMRLRGL